MYNSGRSMRGVSLAGLAAVLACTLGCGGSSSNNVGAAPNTYLYVGGAPIAQLQVKADGTLKPLSPATVGTASFQNGAFAATVPSNQYLFASSSPGNGSYIMSQYMIGTDGTLTPSAITPFGSNFLSQFAFTPDGKFAVVPTSGLCTSCFTGALNAYGLSSSGTLTLVDQTSVSGVPCQASGGFVAVEPSGHFIYVLCSFEGSNSIYEYSISANGAMTLLSPASVVAENGAFSLTVAPNGFLYAVNRGGTVTAFWIDESTGQLANAGSFATGTGTTGGPQWIAFDPTGTYAYVTNTNDNSVSQFTVNASSGALTMNGPDIATGQSPWQVVVDPSGKFAFVTNTADGTISQFTLGNTGRLTPNGTFSLGAQSYPTTMAFAQR